MLKKANLTCEKNTLFLSGELDFSNVMYFYEKSIPYINQWSDIIVDFSSLEVCNSAALALIVEWMKLVNLLNKPMHFSHLSTKLMSIAKVAGMDHLLV